MLDKELNSLIKFLQKINTLHLSIEYDTLEARSKNKEWIQQSLDSMIDILDISLRSFIKSRTGQETQQVNQASVPTGPSLFNLNVEELDREFTEDLTAGRLSEEDYKDQLEDDEEDDDG